MVKMGGLGSLLLAGFLFLVLPGFLSAQSNTAQLIGRISDSSGGIIAGAEIVVVNEVQGFQRSVSSNDNGYYFCPILPEGIYRISVAVAGFQPNVRSGIRLSTQQTVRVDFILDLGKVSQVVEVVEPPLRLNTENGQLSDVRPRDDLLNLPVNDRSAIKFFFLTSFNYQGSGSSFSLGGLRGINTNFTIDGVSTNSALFGGQVGPMTESSLESVRELKVFTSNNSAEFPGVGTVMITSRAGGNQLHGSAFFLSSNNALNARNPFSPDHPKGPRAHEFGISLGGPVLLPSLYDGHQKTFFYFTWEQQRHLGGTTQTANVPTLKMRQGDFSELLPGTLIMDPLTQRPFPGNQIPAYRLNPVSLRIQNFGFLFPNYGPPGNFSANWRGTFPDLEYNNRVVFRVDHQFNPSDLLSVRLSFRSIPLPGVYDADLPIFRHDQERQTRNVYLSESHAFSSKLLNEIRFAYSRDFSRSMGLHNGSSLVEQFGLEGISWEGKGDLTGVPAMQFVNFSNMGEYPSSYWMSETYEFLDDAHFSRGKHNLSAGLLFQRNRGNITACCTSDFGTFSFDGFAARFDYADFLLGLPQSSRRFDRSQPRYNRYSELGSYLHEDYQVAPRFTLNFGLRYEYFFPPRDKHDMRFSFDPQTGDLILASAQSEKLVKPGFPDTIPLRVAQDAGYPPHTLLDGQKTNFGPRLGFAYRILDHTALRGGYGIYYTRLAATLMERFSGGPFQINERYQNLIQAGGPLFQFPKAFPEINSIQRQSISPAARNISAPYTQQWNLTLEHEFPHAILARATYRGFITVQIPYVADVNKPAASNNPDARDFYRYLNFSEVNFAQDGGIQKMNALDVAVERKFTHGLTFQSGWTWAKNLTDVGNDDETDVIENPYDRRREMANILWTPRHRLVAQAFYALPSLVPRDSTAGKDGLIRFLLDNWRMSSILVLQTGQFLTPLFAGSDPSNTRTQGGRPDQVGLPRLSDPTPSTWFNAAAFAVPPNGRFGNSARGVIVGPGLVNWDFGLYKHFPIKEKVQLQLRATVTNLLNHPNFGNPNLDISSLNVGKITSLQGDRRDSLGAGPRTLQLGIRFDF